MYIVGFNGPPRSGKDTLAEMLADHMDKQGVTLPVRMESLSLPLREIAYAMVGRKYDESTYEAFKVEWFPDLQRHGRQLLIDVSESFLKPTYGISIMSKLLRARHPDFHGVLLVRDCGFQVEVDPLVDWAGVGHLYLVQVHRPETSFDGDSREWVYNHTGKMICVDNTQDLSYLRTEAGRIYGRLVNQLGWKL